MRDGVWMDEVVENNDLVDGLLKPKSGDCAACLGFGKVSLPATQMRTSFGTVKREPKVVTCPICGGSGRGR